LAWALCRGLAFSLLFPALGAETNGLARVEFREPRASAYLVPGSAASGAKTAGRSAVAATAGQTWTTAWIEGSTNTVELGNRVVLQLEPGRNLDAFLAGGQLTRSRTIRSNLFILQATDSRTAIEAAAALAPREGVLASYPVMRRPLRHHDAYAPAPNDPRFAEQWNLENRGADGNLAGPDLNVRAAWPATRGDGVVVAVADEGFQLDHPELATQQSSDLHFNFYRNTASGGPASPDANHGTAVAGLIAATQDNHRGLSGIAPSARLASWVVFGTSHGQESIASDEQLMDMFQYASNRVAVQNHSWGSTSSSQVALDALTDSGIASAVTSGRDGKGVVIVRAAGNEREGLINANDDGYANDPRVIAVAALRQDGRACSYSSPGACLLVAAPSGDAIDTNNDGLADATDPNAPDVLTTDRTGAEGYNTDATTAGDYTGFDGTSASSPQVAGVAALILSANPALTYRDVQQILVHSARHYDLADPDVHTNGAGLRFSHNVGFGVPDAGFAVQLARAWSNRPPVTRLSFTNTSRLNIPDDSLRVICAASGLPTSLASIRCLPSLGLHPDEPTSALPLVDVGMANDELTDDLHGKVALIQRGISYFSDKIARAARAGAVAAVIYNHVGTTDIQAMGGTTFVPIPAVSIGKSDGEALRDFLAVHPETTAALQLTPVVYRFAVDATLACEQVGVRLKTTHTSRSDVRVALVSPQGSRSVLQAINDDSARGPTDWTYWTVQHFYEASRGEWRLEVSDERNTQVSTFSTGTVSATGAVIYAELILTGVGIVDRDGDGLDDAWEQRAFGSLNLGPRDDPDGDGFNNAREQVMGTDPMTPNAPLRLEFAELSPGRWRFSWPGLEGGSYRLQTGSELGQTWSDVSQVPGRFPVTEQVFPAPAGPRQFYRLNGSD
jgi:subtilisin family serine protease